MDEDIIMERHPGKNNAEGKHLDVCIAILRNLNMDENKEIKILNKN